MDSAEASLEEAEVVSLEHNEGTVLRIPPMEHRSVGNLAVNDNKASYVMDTVQSDHKNSQTVIIIHFVFYGYFIPQIPQGNMV